MQTLRLRKDVLLTTWELKTSDLVYDPNVNLVTNFRGLEYTPVEDIFDLKPAENDEVYTLVTLESGHVYIQDSLSYENHMYVLQNPILIGHL